HAARGTVVARLPANACGLSAITSDSATVLPMNEIRWSCGDRPRAIAGQRARAQKPRPTGSARTITNCAASTEIGTASPSGGPSGSIQAAADYRNREACAETGKAGQCDRECRRGARQRTVAVRHAANRAGGDEQHTGGDIRWRGEQPDEPDGKRGQKHERR